ncbi:MAG: tagaturonate reductase [Erysipelotrichaceae bacterium]|nr:tagaturonate reductase [Erysipelotrichaceae bacterium]
MNNLNLELTKAVKRPITVMQYGGGNFLRAFVDYFFDLANEKGLYNGSVAIVESLPNSNVDRFKGQDCQYTLQLRGNINGEKYVETRVITSVAKALTLTHDFDEYMDLAKEESLCFVVSNTTEAGIVFNGEDKFDDKFYVTFPAKLTQFLYARYQNFNGDMSKGLIMLPVELIDDNGIVLKKYVLDYADLWNLEDGFKNWLKEACVFTSTLVDRIVPGFPRDEKDQICAQLGYNDDLLDTAEPFALWVIESPKDISKELPLDKALVGKTNMDIIFTDNQKPYKQRKVRILNGAHTSFVLASYLIGHDTVKESMDDELVRNFMNETIQEEIIPTLTLPREELKAFADAVVDRFNNPFIKHALLSISLNSVSKWRARCMPSLLGYVEKNGKLPKNLAFSIAALLAFYKGSKIEDSALLGDRNGETYKIMDDPDVLEFFRDNSALPAKELTEKYLSNVKFHGQDLTLVPGLVDEVAKDLDNIRTYGARKAMEMLK